MRVVPKKKEILILPFLIGSGAMDASGPIFLPGMLQNLPVTGSGVK